MATMAVRALTKCSSISRIVPAVASLLALAMLSPGLALITEQQLGAVDWHRQYLGRVTDAVFAPANRPRLYVASEPGAIAALNLRNGSIVWRQVLAEGDSIDGLWHLPPPAAALLTLSGGGKALRAWSAADGSLLWERLLIGERAAGPAPAQALLLENGVVVTMTAGTVQALSVSEDAAKLLWTLEVPELKASLATDLVETGPVSLLVAGITAGDAAITVAKIAWSETDGAELRSVIETKSSVALAASVRIVGGTVVAVSQSGRQLYLAPAAGVDATSSVTLSQEVRSLAGPRGGSPILAAALDDSILVHVAKAGVLQPAGTYQGATAVTNAVSSGNEQVVGIVGVDEVGVRLRVLSLEHGEERYEDTFQVVSQALHDGAPTSAAAAFMDSYRRKDDSKGYRVLVVLEDDTLVLGQQGQAVWMRPDGLAAVRATMFMDLPTRQELAEEHRPEEHSASSIVDFLRDRLRFEFLNVKAGLQQATPEEQAFRAAYRSQLSSRLSPARDRDGFRKLLLVLTERGTLAGLHNGDGRVVWSRSYGAGAAPAHLLPWRSSHDVQHAPEARSQSA